jgi:hypothetical protein
VRLTRSSIILAVVGVLLIIAAAVVRFAVVPNVTQLPEDLDVTLHFEGTYSGINPAVLTGGATEVSVESPIEASRQVIAEESDGDTELVRRIDTRTVGGGEPSVTEVVFNVDRETAEAVAPPEGADDVVDAEGLVFTFPVDPEPESGEYTYWDQYTLQHEDVEYVGEDTLGGRDVYNYQSVASGPLADPGALGLPTVLPKEKLTELAPALAGSLDPALLALLPDVLPSLPAEIPIDWTSETTTRVSADQELGATVAGGSTQVITGALNLGLGDPIVVEFATIEIDSTDDSIDERGSDVSDDAGLLNLIGTILPIIALVLGLLLIIAAILLAVRAAKRTGGTPSAGATTLA